MNSAYDEILDFVTSAPTLSEIIAFRHSAETMGRVAYLERAEATSQITDAEREELREFQKASYFIEQLKLRARRRLRESEAS